MMDRRDLMKYGMGVACVATIPEILTINLPALDLEAGLHRIPWIEVPGSASYLDRLRGLQRTFKANGSKIRSLTPTEWDTFGTAHETYMTYHAKNGNLHQADLQIRANEAWLKTKYNPAHVSHLVEYGTYAHLSFQSMVHHQVANRLRQAGMNPEDGCTGPADLFYGGVTVWWILVAFLMPELWFFAGVMGIIWEVNREFMCA